MRFFYARTAVTIAITAVLWYTLIMTVNKNTTAYSTTKQLKLPLDLEKIIDISDPVYGFCEVMDRIDLSKFFADKERKTGRPRCDLVKMLKLVLFSFMENGYLSLRGMEKACRTDIRYMWILDGMRAPSFMTFDNFINKVLCDSVEEVFKAVNRVIFEQNGVDLSHAYIDGTKIEANANKYSWVWKKSCVTNRQRVFEKLTELIVIINTEDLASLGLRMETREEYAIEYVEMLLETYKKAMNIDEGSFVSGSGHRKTPQQRRYQLLENYRDRLKGYAERIETCGEGRNSYSKTDTGATFMRVKRDYMGNDQLLPAYNMQEVICDGYIAVIDAKQYASDQECFVPLMEKFRRLYGRYPKYPVADAGYGSYNNYIYCEKVGMEKFMKFTMFEKETKDPKYREDPFRAVNFSKDEAGNPVCPQGRKFIHKCTQKVKGNQYGRTEEVFECEDCSNCPCKERCSKAEGNRIIRLNRELSGFHQEVLNNLQSIQGALLCMNRSIQAEGTYGCMKWNRSYKRAFRRGLNSVLLEFTLISIGFNLYKYDNKRKQAQMSA